VRGKPLRKNQRVGHGDADRLMGGDFQSAKLAAVVARESGR
jgi:hypothetical protein